MNDHTNDDGRGALRDQLPRIDVPHALEQRVAATLTARGFIHGKTSRGTVWLRRTGLIAAGLIAGLIGGKAMSDAGSRPAPTQGQYVLLLYGDTPGDTGAVHDARAREYGLWASQLTDGARWVGGSELGNVLETLGPSGSLPSPGVERMAGFFIIEANTPARAAEVARTCPHIKYGGRVVLMNAL